jgi:hypothetical protein
MGTHEASVLVGMVTNVRGGVNELVHVLHLLMSALLTQEAHEEWQYLVRTQTLGLVLIS